MTAFDPDVICRWCPEQGRYIISGPDSIPEDRSANVKHVGWDNERSEYTLEFYREEKTA